MRTWTIILAAAALLLASCSEEDNVKLDKTLTGSISYDYCDVETKVYFNGSVIIQTNHGSAGFTKLDETHVRFGYSASFPDTKDGSYSVLIRRLEAHGRPYDVSFDYYSESGEDGFSIDNVEQPYKSIKMEGGLYSGFADVRNTPHFATRDWSPPVFKSDLKIAITMEDGNEYMIEITGMY